jgi:apolipoprotein N-acyltransferase
MTPRQTSPGAASPNGGEVIPGPIRRSAMPDSSGNAVASRRLAQARLPLAFLLTLLAFPPAHLPPAALVFIVPLLLEAADHSRSLRARALRLFATCASVGLIKFWWLAGSVVMAIGAPPAPAMIVVVAYVATLAAAYTAAMLLPQALPPAWRLPASFILLGACAIAVPWPLPVSFAHGVLDLPPLAGLAALGGVAAVDLAIIGINTLFAAALLRPSRARCATAAGAALVTLGTGWLAMPAPTIAAPPTEVVRVAVIQPDVPLFRRLVADPALRVAMQDRVLAMMEDAAAATPPPQLIVLPEYPSLLHFFLRPDDHQRIAQFAATRRIPVLLTAFRAQDERRLASSTVLVDPSGSASFTDKQVLFPFGEYLPGESHLPWLRRAFPDAGALSQGDPPRTLSLSGSGIPLAVLMCFDDTMTQVARSVLAALPPGRPALAISMGNTQSFGDDRARDLHLMLSRYRAIESGMPLLRVGNDGHSGLVLPDGRLRDSDRLPAGMQAWAIMDIPLTTPPRQHATAIDGVLRFGFVHAAALLLGGLVVTRLARRRPAGR